MDTRKTCKLVLGCDDLMPEIMRKKWIRNFWMLDELQGLGFRRDIATVNLDAALDMILMMSVYIGFKRLG